MSSINDIEHDHVITEKSIQQIIKKIYTYTIQLMKEQDEENYNVQELMEQVQQKLLQFQHVDRHFHVNTYFYRCIVFAFFFHKCMLIDLLCVL